MKRWLVLSVMLLVAIVALAPVLWAGPPVPNVVGPEAVNVAVRPATLYVYPGQVFDVRVQLEGSGGVVGADMWLRFDTTYLKALAVYDGGALPVQLAASVDNTTGVVKYGAGTFGSPVNAPFTLAIVRFQAKGPLGNTNLVLDPAHTDVQGTSGSLLGALVNGTVHIVPAPTPTPTPTVTPTPTPTATPSPTPTRTPTPTPTATPTPLPVQVCAFAFLDENRDGRPQGDEPLLAGASVRLYQGPPPGTLVEERTTTTAGPTCFEPQPAGFYTVQEVNPPGYISTSPDWWGLYLAPGAQVTLAFGDVPEGAVVRGVLFVDEDGDGVQDAGEPGIPDALVVLEGDGQRERYLAARWETRTDAQGQFAFTGVTPGSYTLTAVEVPPGYLPPPPQQVEVQSGAAEVTVEAPAPAPRYRVYVPRVTR